jgi:hypothetical protein
MNDVINIIAFSLLATLWLAFAGALIASRPSLDLAWRRVDPAGDARPRRLGGRATYRDVAARGSAHCRRHARVRHAQRLPAARHRMSGAGVATRAHAERVSPRRRRVVVAVAGFVGVGALFGGYGLLTDAESVGVNEAWLEGSPFPDYRLPGVVLLVVIGGGMLATALLALRRSRLAASAALAMGVALLVWGTVETIAIGYQGVAQLMLLAVWVVGPAVPLLWAGWTTGAGVRRRDVKR